MQHLHELYKLKYKKLTNHVVFVGSITSKTIQILEKGNRILEKHLDTFIRDGNMSHSACSVQYKADIFFFVGQCGAFVSHPSLS